MYLINGAESETLAVNDRSVQFGDGCFTTARIVRGRVQLLSAHLARLQKACEQLFIPLRRLGAISARDGASGAAPSGWRAEGHHHARGGGADTALPAA